VEHALALHWKAAGLTAATVPKPYLAEAPTALCVSGSRSVVTARQVAHAARAGWETVPLDIARALDPVTRAAEVQSAAARSANALADGRGVVVHTSDGPDLSLDPVRNRALGEALGAVAAATIDVSGVRRLLLAGGDSSGHVLRGIGATTLEVAAPFAPSMPVCRAQGLEGLEIVCKGGQLGDLSVIEDVRRGSRLAEATHERPRRSG
jgi:uncharacterized protein YgbK (DUF1537 family)